MREVILNQSSSPIAVARQSRALFLIAGMLLCVMSAFSLPAHAEEPSARPFLHPLFADGMVLQRDVPAPVWGWCQPGQDVTVEVAGKTATAKAGADGRWEARVGPIGAGGPIELKVSGPKQVTVKDVLVGDVWVCSGQSNMQGNLERQNDAAVIAAANHPGMRFMAHIPGNEDLGADLPLDVFGLTKGTWQTVTPATADKLSRVAYYFGRDLHQQYKVPIGVIVVALNGSPIESWMPREAMMSLPAYEVDGRFYAADDAYNEIIPQWYLPAARYNSLIHPIAPFGIKGFLWYQGETNAAWRPSNNRYAKLLQLMIRGWRANWDGAEIPFVTVQLPDTPKSKEMSSPIRRSGWAEVQAAQAQSLALPKTAVAICMDLGDGDLHPKTKDKIGARAALAARRVAYGEKIVGMGPTCAGTKIDGNTVRVSFDNVGSGLVSNDGEPLRFFAVAGEDRNFVWADAKIEPPAGAGRAAETVIVSSPKVARPVAVRYGWVQNGLVNLYNQEGLPASPFRSDEWDDEVGPEGTRLKGPEGKGIPWDGRAVRSPFAALAWDVQHGRLEAVKADLAGQPEAIKQCNAAGTNLLNIAIALGHADVVRFLMENGADPSLPELSGLYPIHRAAFHGRAEVAAALLSAGANPRQETRNPGRATPLFFAARQDQAEIAKLLLDRGAEVEAGRQFYRPGSGVETETPLYASFEKAAGGSAACLLVERGARVNEMFPNGDLPIHLAARKDLARVIECLLAKGADVNAANRKQETPLEAAASGGARGAIELLLKKGATVTPAAVEAAKKRNDAAALKLLSSGSAK